MSDKRLKIALFMPQHFGYARDVFCGVLSQVARPRMIEFRHFEYASYMIEPMRTWGPDGIIAYMEPWDEISRLLLDLKLPVVNIGNPCPGVHRIGPDDVKVGEMAADYFLQKGFRNFGFIHYSSLPFSLDRCKGFRQALEKGGHGLAECQRNMGLTAWHVVLEWEAEMGSLAKWLAQQPRPIAVMAANDVVGSRTLQVCRYANLKVPEEVAVLAVDNDEMECLLSDPPLSSIQLAGKRIGAQAIDLLMELIAGKKMGEGATYVSPVGVVERQSSDILAIDIPDAAQAVRYIRQRADQPITVEDVLREVPVARRSLERQFRQVLGRSPLQEIRRVHIEAAKHYLSTTNMDIPGIAERSGFLRTTTFCKVFRAEVGMTPMQYRRST